jgi:hypothetical protein
MLKSEPILDKLTEISERLAVVETHIGYLSVDLAEVKQQDMIQNRLLEEHIAGVETARQLIAMEKQTRTGQIEDLDLRITTVEFFPKFVQNFKIIILWVGGIATALVGIAKFIGLF